MTQPNNTADVVHDIRLNCSTPLTVGPKNLMQRAADIIEAQATEIAALRERCEKLEEALKPLADKETCAEMLDDSAPPEWLGKPPFARIEFIRQKKEAHDAAVIAARSELATYNASKGGE